MESEASGQPIALIPIGPIPCRMLSDLELYLGPTFDCSCRVLAVLTIPETAYDQRRGQYLGEEILAALAELDVPEAERLLGVIDADCCAPGLNFVFGQASIHGREAFIALPRLRTTFYGLPDNEALFRERMRKEAVHELGHTYGLRHCPDRRCVMHFSNSLHDTDVKGQQFCPRCRARLDQALGTR